MADDLPPHLAGFFLRRIGHTETQTLKVHLEWYRARCAHFEKLADRRGVDLAEAQRRLMDACNPGPR